MRTVIIAQGFEVDDPKPARYEAGGEVTVSEAAAADWIAKGLAKAAAKKSETKAADAKTSPKSAD